MGDNLKITYYQSNNIPFAVYDLIRADQVQLRFEHQITSTIF